MSRPKWREDAEHLKRLIKEARARRGKGHNRGRDIREIRRMLSAKFYEIDDPVHEILPVQDHIAGILRRSWANGKRGDVTLLSVGLAGLWEASRVHMLLLRKMLTTDTRISRQELTEISHGLFVNWFSNASDRMKSLKRPLSRLAGFESAFYQVATPAGKSNARKTRPRHL